MKILYAIQGTGNGHVSRAREIIPHLEKLGELDLLLSGTQAEVELDQPIKYRFHGFGFVFGKKGGVDILKSWKEFDTRSFIRDLKSLPVESYDLIINDFEPVSAWACKLKGKECISLSHQSAFYSKKTPHLKGFHWGRIIMNNYAPTTDHVGFHFERYDDFIRTPVIRSEIRRLPTCDKGHYTVYLPAYSDEFILNQTTKHPEVKWRVFSKHSKESYEMQNTKVYPINNQLFQDSLASCTGLLTGGGFEGPAEALFLGKKVLSVPMSNQYEQQCNSLALERMGVPVIWKETQFSSKLKSWVESSERVEVHFPDETAEVIEKLVQRYGKV